MEERKRLIAFHVSEVQADALELLASRRNQSVSALIRGILGLHIKEFSPPPPLQPMEPLRQS
jgi:hypothetical protein